MKLYRYLYGSGRLDDYSLLQQSAGLTEFLYEHNIDEGIDKVLKDVRDFFHGMSPMPGYDRYPKSERPKAIRYAPLYYDGLLRRPSVKPIYAFGVCAEENRGSEGKWEKQSSNRQTFFSQIDFFSAAQARREGKYTHLDMLFGIRPMTDADVRDVRNGSVSVDESHIIDRIIPVLDIDDRNHVLAAAAALYEGKNIAICLEEGVPFNRRAKELLTNIYSLLQPSDAYRTGYSIYQNPKSIAAIIKKRSVKVFVIPGDRDPKNGEVAVDPVLDVPKDVVVVDMREPCIRNHTELWDTLEKWLEIPCELRLHALDTILQGKNMLRSYEDEEADRCHKEFLRRSAAFFAEAQELEKWQSNTCLKNVCSLKELYSLYRTHIENLKTIPWKDEIFRSSVEREAKRRRAAIAKGHNDIIPLDIGRMTADVYVELMLNQHEALGQELTELYRFGQSLSAPDMQTVWKSCEKHQNEIRQELIEKAITEIRRGYEAKIGILEGNQKEYTRVKDLLELGEFAEEEQVKTKIRQMCADLESCTRKLQNCIEAMGTAHEDGSDPVTSIRSLCGQLAVLTNENQRLMEKKEMLDRCHSELECTGNEKDTIHRIRDLKQKERSFHDIQQELADVDNASDAVAIDAVRAMKKTISNLEAQCKKQSDCLANLCDGKPDEIDIECRIQALRRAEQTIDDCLRSIQEYDQNLSADALGGIAALKKRISDLEQRNSALDQSIKKLNDQGDVNQRITELMEAEKNLQDCIAALTSSGRDVTSGGVADVIRQMGKELDHEKEKIKKAHDDNRKLRKNIQSLKNQLAVAADGKTGIAAIQAIVFPRTGKIPISGHQGEEEETPEDVSAEKNHGEKDVALPDDSIEQVQLQRGEHQHVEGINPDAISGPDSMVPLDEEQSAASPEQMEKQEKTEAIPEGNVEKPDCHANGDQNSDDVNGTAPEENGEDAKDINNQSGDEEDDKRDDGVSNERKRGISKKFLIGTAVICAVLAILTLAMSLLGRPGSEPVPPDTTEGALVETLPVPDDPIVTTPSEPAETTAAPEETVETTVAIETEPNDEEHAPYEHWDNPETQAQMILAVPAIEYIVEEDLSAYGDPDNRYVHHAVFVVSANKTNKKPKEYAVLMTTDDQTGIVSALKDADAVLCDGNIAVAVYGGDRMIPIGIQIFAELRTSGNIGRTPDFYVKLMEEGELVGIQAEILHTYAGEEWIQKVNRFSTQKSDRKEARERLNVNAMPLFVMTVGNQEVLAFDYSANSEKIGEMVKYMWNLGYRGEYLADRQYYLLFVETSID